MIKEICENFKTPVRDKNKDPMLVSWVPGFMKSKQLPTEQQYDFKTVSYKISGSTTSNRGAFDGIVLKVQNESQNAAGEEI